MVATLLSFHGALQWVVLVVIGINLAVAGISFRQQHAYTGYHNILARINIGAAHLQMLLGIILMTHSAKVTADFSPTQLTEASYWSLFHPVLMFAGIVCVTLSVVLLRYKQTDADKHRNALMYNATGLLFFAAGIALMP